MQSDCRHSQEVPHNSLCGNHTKLFIPLSLTLQNHGHLLSISLNKLEVLLLGKFQTSHLIMQNTDIPEEAFLSVVLHDAGLMTKDDTSEELGHK